MQFTRFVSLALLTSSPFVASVTSNPGGEGELPSSQTNNAGEPSTSPTATITGPLYMVQGGQTPTTLTTITLSTKTAPTVVTILSTISSGPSPTATVDLPEPAPPPAPTPDLPPQCYNPDILYALKGDKRKDCTEQIHGLPREGKKLWANIITPPECLSGDDWHPIDPGTLKLLGYHTIFGLEENGAYGESCKAAVTSLKHDERKAWIAGMLPAECPYTHDEQKAAQLGWDASIACDEIQDKYEKWAQTKKEKWACLGIFC